MEKPLPAGSVAEVRDGQPAAVDRDPQREVEVGAVLGEEATQACWYGCSAPMYVAAEWARMSRGVTPELGGGLAVVEGVVFGGAGDRCDDDPFAAEPRQADR
ncbi:hypothetical protein [Dactylosporangium darangshiense]|uniref:hypothetical protein n=1 Tax=Dactylosporangium darangshiense TaxID=579108 RepID=UPI0031E96C68